MCDRCYTRTDRAGFIKNDQSELFLSTFFKRNNDALPIQEGPVFLLVEGPQLSLNTLLDAILGRMHFGPTISRKNRYSTHVDLWEARLQPFECSNKMISALLRPSIGWCVRPMSIHQCMTSGCMLAWCTSKQRWSSAAQVCAMWWFVRNVLLLAISENKD